MHESESAPLLPLGLGDLEGLQQVIALYLRHLGTPGTRARELEQRRRLLGELRTRLERARLSGNDPVCIPLTLAEWQGLKKALAGCAWVVGERAPASPEREDLLRVLEGLRAKIAQIVSASFN